MTNFATRDIFVDAFEASQRSVSCSQTIAELRRRAFDHFLEIGFPTTRLEKWRFSNVAPIANTEFSVAASATIPRSALSTYGVAQSNEENPLLVFVNGRYVSDLSNTVGVPDNVNAGGLADALTSESAAGLVESTLAATASFKGDAFTSINTGMFYDGAFVHVPDNTVVEQLIQLVFVTVPSADGIPIMSNPRVLLLLGDNSEARFIEDYVSYGSGRYLTNGVTEVIGGANARVDHYKLVREDTEAFHIGSMHLRLDRAASFSSHSVTLGGEIVRNDVQAVLDGEGAECTLNGLYLVNGRRLVDNRTTINHAKPHCSSHELYKGILDDQARAVFNGKIVVAIDAQKTDAKQTNKALLLSEEAQINTKPELEIFADDVKCTHGATVGQLDDDALFYLRARGLGFEQARNVLIQAFASDLLERVRLPVVRAQLDRLLLEQLAGLRGRNLA